MKDISSNIGRMYRLRSFTDKFSLNCLFLSIGYVYLGVSIFTLWLLNRNKAI